MIIVRAGTSGYSYKEWKGIFYPTDISEARMLAYYAERLPAVELNNTFYRTPKRSVIESWASQAQPTFRFASKAPRRITHMRRLRDTNDLLGYLFDVLGGFGEKMGPVLFQLPPVSKKDVPLLRDFLALLPESPRAAFEFRHPSWFDDDALAALAERDAALCVGDLDEESKSPPLVATASWGYLRLRRSDYTAGDLAVWAEKVGQQRWSEAYAFFKHEQRGPELAEAFNRAFGK
jgi:uncharacterized protein YecE (DUF72 family)